MGIPSLNSAILYIVSLYFHCHLERASHCHFERAQRVEKSKSCKYNKYPGPRPRKPPFSWIGKEKATAKRSGQYQHVSLLLIL